MVIIVRQKIIDHINLFILKNIEREMRQEKEKNILKLVQEENT